MTDIGLLLSRISYQLSGQAEMAELVNLRFIDYGDTGKITQILLNRRTLVDPEYQRGKNPIPPFFANPEIATQIQ